MWCGSGVVGCDAELFAPFCRNMISADWLRACWQATVESGRVLVGGETQCASRANTTKGQVAQFQLFARFLQGPPASSTMATPAEDAAKQAAHDLAHQCAHVVGPEEKEVMPAHHTARAPLCAPHTLCLVCIAPAPREAEEERRRAASGQPRKAAWYRGVAADA